MYSDYNMTAAESRALQVRDVVRGLVNVSRIFHLGFPGVPR